VDVCCASGREDEANRDRETHSDALHAKPPDVGDNCTL
jgi:hypothetical protein